MLARRIVPAVLALAVALAPVALEACQVACAIHSIAANRTGEAHHHAASDHEKPAAHSCHDVTSASSAGAAAVTGTPHNCSHSGELPANGGAQAQKVLHSPALLRATVALTPAPERTAVRTAIVFARDSIPIALNLPLRV